MFSNDAKLKSLCGYLFWVGMFVGLIVSPVVLIMGIANVGASHGHAIVFPGLLSFTSASLMQFLSFSGGMTLRERGTRDLWYWVPALVMGLVFLLPPCFMLFGGYF